VGILLEIPSILIYGGLVIIGFDDGWDLQTFSGIPDHTDVVNVFQPFDGVRKFVPQVIKGRNVSAFHQIGIQNLENERRDVTQFKSVM
jgi:predicted CoA-binding protein